MPPNSSSTRHNPASDHDGITGQAPHPHRPTLMGRMPPSLRRMSSNGSLGGAGHLDVPHGSDHGGRSSSSRGTPQDDDATSVYSFTTHQSEDSTTKKAKRYLEMQVAVQEEDRVKMSKRIMLIFLFLAAVATSLATYFLLRNAQEDDFEKQFRSYASEIVSVATEHVENSFGSIEAFANSITSAAKDAGEVFPNVTVPDYTSKAIRVAELAANSRLVTYAPLVSAQERVGFEEYARNNIYQQIQEDLDYLNIDSVTAEEVPTIPKVISYFNLTAKSKFQEPEAAPGPFLVNWQRYPFEVEKGRVFVMNNMMRIPTIRSAVVAANQTLQATSSFLEALLGIESQVIQPVFQDVLPPHRDSERQMVGVIWVVLNWANYFQNLLPTNVNGIYVALKSSCGFSATFLVNGLEATNLGLGDLHDPSYDDLVYRADFFNFDNTDASLTSADVNGEQVGTQEDNVVCVDQLVLELYPSDEFKESFSDKEPIIYAVVVFCIFVFTGVVFLIFDWTVRKRQSKVEERLTAQDKIVSNLFPGTIRDRLYNMNDLETSDTDSMSQQTARRELRRDMDDPDILKSRPIADLYLETTVIFADIAGFTAWSSTREPGHVLMLLETIYGAFDKIAHRHNVFKVETIGDCYVAVTGLPEPNKEHAICMARFARDCMSKMKDLTRKLEVSLGPDTGDLSIRVGLHSGQVTAGVLRGERSRFQLFGDTVNTASRMESTGKVEMIHMSSVTAEILRAQGYGQWVRQREDTVVAPGKGEMDTFWLETKGMTKARERVEQGLATGNADMPPPSSKVYFEEDELHGADGLDKEQRLIEWIVETLSENLRQIVAARVTSRPASVTREEQVIGKGDGIVLEETKDVIELPKLSVDDLAKRTDPDTIRLSPEVVDQLRHFITVIACMYPKNAFHNFEHASHVTASVHKLLARIVKVDTTRQTESFSYDGVDLAGHSYGITSDPLTQFAVIFSAIIHDVDHPGVGNAVLIKEKLPLAAQYKNKSIAEQNSVDLAWQLLMSDEYEELRSCIYCNPSELRRFRQMVVNIVMATDIADKEINGLRKERWNKAFAEQAPGNDIRNAKATIVMEHLIQASDVSHCMQHWHIYRKWNEMFFQECMEAYQSGRSDEDPSKGWYQGEIGFFDFYIIPLANKLDTCGVFGVSSHEYLGYARANRNEWERRGKDIVQEYLANWKELQQSKQGIDAMPSTEEESADESTPTEDQVEEFDQEPVEGDLDNV